MSAFCIAGPTATGKSEIAAQVARLIGAEIVNADAFQIYDGLDLLTAKPSEAMRAMVPHHLLGSVPLTEEMNAEKFRVAALGAIREIQAGGKIALVVGGSGLYLKALTHGLASLPKADRLLREKLTGATNEELIAQLSELDPVGAGEIDRKNKRRLVRAVEVCLLTGRPFSAQRTGWNGAETIAGIFLFRERAELYERINRRVEQMFASGVVEEVRRTGEVRSTAEKTLGLREILALIAGEMTEPECVAKIQQATRRYAKRQLTWFQRQVSFWPVNLSRHDSSAAIELIVQRAKVFA
ncbi:MAG: tRNA (adenosine(37)-N6)-dimethylallyltransferase MiaA [Verrucomicrobiota bacterium]